MYGASGRRRCLAASVRRQTEVTPLKRLASGLLIAHAFAVASPVAPDVWVEAPAEQEAAGPTYAASAGRQPLHGSARLSGEAAAVAADAAAGAAGAGAGKRQLGVAATPADAAGDVANAAQGAVLAELIAAARVLAEAARTNSSGTPKLEFGLDAVSDLGAFDAGSYGSADARRLEIITNELNYSATRLTLTLNEVYLSGPSSPILCFPGQCVSVMGLYAGLEIMRTEIGQTPHTFNAPSAKLSIVDSAVDRDAAQAGACRTGNYETAIHGAVLGLGSEWVTGAETDYNGQEVLLAGTDEYPTGLTFLQGGEFKFCYSDDGSFLGQHADVVPYPLVVHGVYDNYIGVDNAFCATSDTCLMSKRYYCYILKNSYNNMADDYTLPTSCIVNYAYDGAGFVGPVGKGSWSARYGTVYTGSSQDVVSQVVIPESATGSPCTTAPDAAICNSGDCTMGQPMVDPDEQHDYKRINLPVARDDLTGTDYTAFTVAACYCPDYSQCDAVTDFLQQVGLLHFFAAKVCTYGFPARDCEDDYNGATPQHRFSIKVECPTDACTTTGSSLIAVVAQRASNELPSWDEGNTCFEGTPIHGINSVGYNVFPPEVNRLTAYTYAESGRNQFKIWNFPDNPTLDDWGLPVEEEAGYMFMMGTSDYEKRNSHTSETFDICFCDDLCDPNELGFVQSNWYKVGQLRFAAFQPVSAATNISNEPELFAVTYLNLPGIFGFWRPPLDHGLMGMQEAGMVKFVQDPDWTIDDAGCADSRFYDPVGIPIMDGLFPTTAHTTFAGTMPPEDPNRLIFNGGSTTNVLTPMFAGTVAVCYCAKVNQGECDFDRWILTSRHTIRGPTGGMEWEVSSYVVFMMDLTGFGLSSEDKVRIIPAEDDCQENLGNPNAAYTVTSIKLQCPYPCTEVGQVTDAVNGDIDIQVASSQEYGCDNQHVNCRTNDIKAVVVLDETTTELEFESPIDFVDGDYITLTDNLGCGVGCTEEMLSVVMGKFRYVDQMDNAPTAPDHYIAGHKVTVDPTSNKKVTINVGWPDPKPLFEVLYIDAKRTQWVRHNRANTKLEIVGERQREGMRVCWKYGGTEQQRLAGMPKFVGQVGSLSFIDPNPMAGCYVDLTTLMRNQEAEFIISFSTAAAATGRRYGDAEDSMQLRFFFVDTLALDIKFGDSGVIEQNSGEDEVVDARQYICGKLFREVWSSDKELGFPLPKGCYYKVYGNIKEVNVIFEPKNGLQAGQDYQVVMKGVAQDKAQAPHKYLHILSMDDMVSLPYSAVERGLAQLRQTPQLPAYGTEGVRFLYPNGMTLRGSTYASMIELKGGDVISMQLKGEVLGGGIKANAFLRVYLYPLLMWDIDNSCSARCIPYDPISAPCGAIQDCKGLPIVANSNKNVAVIQLPHDMETMTQFIAHTVEIQGLALPQGGFFPQKLAGQLTTEDDVKPHYVVSVGDFLWKKPDDGQSVGKLVDVYGDGNQAPFRGDKMNILYARIQLAATLFSAIQTGDAVMTIILPEGYECIRTLDVDGRSPWQAPDDLNIWQETGAPFGSGVPDEGSGARGWSVVNNTCIFTLRQNAVVFGGSALTIRITANNPMEAMTREDERNRWSVLTKGKGYHQWQAEFDPAVFKTDGLSYYSQNVAVMGKLTDIFIMPDIFSRSYTVEQFSLGWVSVFFKTEQTTGVFGGLQLEAPPTFEFTGDPCQVRELADMYYATHAQPPTKRMPGYLTCQWFQEPFNYADISFEGALLEQTIYGLKIQVKNPIDYNETQRSGWRIYTLSQTKYRVDGTSTNPMFAQLDTEVATVTNEMVNLSWGLCERAWNTPSQARVVLSINSMLPFHYTQIRASLLVRPLTVPSNGFYTFVFTAPYGYEFDFVDSEFLYVSPNDGTPNNVLPDCQFSGCNITATLPEGIPVWNGNLLHWPVGANYFASERYGFQVPIKVPIMGPTGSLNAFLAQLYTGGTDNCAAASYVDAPVVRALRNARVEYDNNVFTKENQIHVQIETVTYIAFMGTLVLKGPPGFTIDDCTPLPAPAPRGSSYEYVPTPMAFPVDWTCSADSPDGERFTYTITAGPLGIPAGLYRFSVNLQNPSEAFDNPYVNGLTGCGYWYCFDFHSFDYAGNVYDVNASYRAFPINIKMVEATIPELTVAQQAATGRDDRPEHYNPLLFAFMLRNPAVSAGEMKLKAPVGFVFREDCLQDVEIRAAEVFGSGQPIPQGFEAWNPDMVIESCRGEGPDVVMYLNPGLSMGLASETLYPFRLAAYLNPKDQPEYNYFSLDYNGESSDPFVGFLLWTFKRVQVVAASDARSTPLASEEKLKNPITITFRPYNAIKRMGMRIKVTAPPNFEFVHDNYECIMMVQTITESGAIDAAQDPETVPEPNYMGPPSLSWGQADVDCQVDPENLGYLVGEVLSDERELEAGRDYQMTVYVYNPSLTQPAEENIWKLETENSVLDSPVLPTFRDSVKFEGYEVIERAYQFFYRNEDPFTGYVFVNGLQDVPGLYFEVMFPGKLEYDNEITVDSPYGFNFRQGDTPNSCGGFIWEPSDEDTINEQYLPNSPLTCVGGTLTFTIREPRSIPEFRLLKFRMDTKNPDATPHVMLNHWSVTHLGPRAPDGSPGEIFATAAMAGWEIRQQLASVEAHLVGLYRRAGSKSSISVAFTPVSAADEVRLTARLFDADPTARGFDFTGAYATSLGHEVIETDMESIRVRASIFSGVFASVRIADLRLPEPGGPTEFDFYTYLSSGDKVDEALEFRGGYRQPGRVDIFEKSMLSVWQQDPATYPVTSTWGARMGEQVRIEFHFTTTMQGILGSMLRIKSAPYTLYASPFEMKSLGTHVAVTVITVSGGEMVTRVEDNIWVGQEYMVAVRADAPFLVLPEDSMWTLDIIDENPLQVATNDALTEGFPLVDVIEFAVSSGTPPPMATVAVFLDVDPKYWRPTTMLLVAPEGYNFTADCLEHPGDFGEIESCRYVGLNPGPPQRAMAEIKVAAEYGLLSPPSFVRIRIITPAANPDNPSWYMRLSNSTMEHGWGEDPVGISVRQMLGAAVLYPAVPAIEGQMAFTFITGLQVDEGGQLKVFYPSSVVIQCNGAYLHKIYLTGRVDCNNYPASGFFELIMERPLPPGVQAFAVTSVMPQAIYEANEYSIMLFDPSGEVVDAAMGIPGLPMQLGLDVGYSDITWSSSEPNKPGTVTLGYEQLSDMPELVLSPPIVAELVFTVPPDFFHAVTRAAQVEQMADLLPLIPGDTEWIDFSNPTRVNIFLDQQAMQVKTPGLFRFQIPVMVPGRMPNNNLWTLTLCSPSPTNASCTGPEDPRMMVVFPMSGFALNEEPTDALVYTAAGGASRRSSPMGFRLLWHGGGQRGRQHILSVLPAVAATMLLTGAMSALSTAMP